MKLFIVNKDQFDGDYSNDPNTTGMLQKDVHKKAFTILSKKITSDYALPLEIVVQTDKGEAVFKFKNATNNTFYHYLYMGTFQ